MSALPPPDRRQHALDAVRGFALLLGVAFHSAVSFIPGALPGSWAAIDRSSSTFLGVGAFATHVFRMSLFFFIAGFFARLLRERLGTHGFWNNRLKRILAPLILGWAIVYPSLAVLWTIGLARTASSAPPASGKIRGLADFPLTHLWFLYDLMLIYLFVLVVRAVIVRFDPKQSLRLVVDALVARSIRTMAATFILGLPVAAVLASQSSWYFWAGIQTPDQSLIPGLAPSIGFGTAFIFGWLVNRSVGALPALTARCMPNLVIAILATSWLIYMLYTNPPLATRGSTSTLFALDYGLATWSWVLGLTGAALRFLSDHSATRRYIADASYWIYIMHLPLVVALQILVADWHLHWSVKYPFILTVSLALLFLSYHIMVRSTFIGALLNGRNSQPTIERVQLRQVPRYRLQPSGRHSWRMAERQVWPASAKQQDKFTRVPFRVCSHLVQKA